MSFSKFPIGKLIFVAILVSLVFGACGLYGYANQVRSEGVRQEQAMTAQYKANQNELSAHVSTIYQSVDVANLKSDKMNTILSNAVQGRYGPDGFKPGTGAVFSAIQEAYPNLDLGLYDKILEAVQSGIAAFKNSQNKLTDMKRAYDTWRYDGIVRSYFATKYFPSSMLKVTVNGKEYVGAEALKMLDQQVLATEASAAFESGKMPTLDIKNR